jgi:hypothetical protein
MSPTFGPDGCLDKFSKQWNMKKEPRQYLLVSELKDGGEDLG